MHLDDLWESDEDRLRTRLAQVEELCQLMWDPENQPPQFSAKEAWEKYKAIV